MADNEIGVTITGDVTDILSQLDNLVSELSEITDKVVDLIINVNDDQLVTVNSETDEVTESLNEASDAANGLGENLDAIDTTNLDAAKESADGLSESLSGAGNEAEGTSTTTGGTSGGTEDAMGAIGSAAAAVGAFGILDQLAGAAGNYSDSWAMLGSVMGESASEAEAAWTGAVSTMASNTGRRASDIRNYITQMGIAGVTSQSTMIDMFTGISGAAFATGNSVESVTSAYRRVIATGTLGARQLMSLGLSEQDVYNATGMTLDEVNEKLSGMDSNSRAAFMANIVNAKYAGAANENYKSSWQHVKDQMGASWDMFVRIFGQMIMPIVIPALQILTVLLQGVAKWFNSLNSNQKLLIGTILVLVLGFIGLAATIGAFLAVWNLLSLSMMANPIFLVVFAVAALVAAFLYFYNTNEQFRKSIDGVWAGLTNFGAWLQGGFNSIVTGVTTTWNNFVNALIGGLNWFITLPQRMAAWGYNAAKSFADGLKKGVKPVTDALGAIGKLFPHSPPKEGPLADIKPEGMSSWMDTIVGAGNASLAKLNMNNVGMPRVGNTTNNSGLTASFGDVIITDGSNAKQVGKDLVSGLSEGWAEKVQKQAINRGISPVNSMR